MPCRICSHVSYSFYQHKKKSYAYCPNCASVQLCENCFLTAEEEQAHYEHHENHSIDMGYRKFVQPVTDAVMFHFDSNHKGLDFGSGKDAAAVAILRENGFQIDAYDPFFYPNKKWNLQQYDFITATEVVEHLHEPMQTFKELKSLLKPKGKLFLMTELFAPQLSFHQWYYKNDPTHVVFYSEKTMQWLADCLGFSRVTIQKRLVVMEF